MIVIGIAGILASLALPVFNSYKTKVRFSELHEGMSALFKGEAARYQLAEGYRTKRNCSPKVVNGCRGPGDGGWVTVPGVEPVHFDFGTLDSCKELGFVMDAPTYFAWEAQNASDGCVAGIGIKGWTYWNVAYQDMDGDGDIGSYVEVIGEKNGELYRGGRFQYGDQTMLGFTIQLFSPGGIPEAP